MYVVAAALVLILGGCHTISSRPWISLDEIVKMSKEGMAPNAIIADLEQRRVQLEFSGSQLAKLKEQGVADEVLDYLLNAYARRIRYESLQDYEPYWRYHPYYYYYPAPRTVIVEPLRR
jgi:hypothetical protein